MEEETPGAGTGSETPVSELLPSFKTCYFCGTGNPRGFQIRYSYDPEADRVTGETRPDQSYCGYPGVLHGGVQSALLDDIMYWAVCYREATSSVTVELACRYRKPAPLGEPLTLDARCGERRGRKIHAEGRLLDGAGTLLAEATALYLLHPREDFVAKMLPFFDFGGCSRPMVEHFTGGRAEGVPRP